MTDRSENQSPIKGRTISKNALQSTKEEMQETESVDIDESIMPTLIGEEEEESFTNQLRVDELSQYNKSREILVDLMKNLLIIVTKLSKFYPERAKEIVISLLEDENNGIWPKIVSLSMLITDRNNFGSHEEIKERTESEIRYKEKLIYLRSKIHFLAR